MRALWCQCSTPVGLPFNILYAFERGVKLAKRGRIIHFNEEEHH